jgi:hypothetical protein
MEATTRALELVAVIVALAKVLTFTVSSRSGAIGAAISYFASLMPILHAGRGYVVIFGSKTDRPPLPH